MGYFPRIQQKLNFPMRSLRIESSEENGIRMRSDKDFQYYFDISKHFQRLES